MTTNSGNDSPLVDEILDSLGIAEIVVFIEEHMGMVLRWKAVFSAKPLGPHWDCE
jgi:acyl carrier protein